MRRVGLASLLALTFALGAARARAADAATPPELDLSPSVAQTRLEVPTLMHAFGELSLGKGLHFNNPYRLGSTDAVGFTATYVDLGLGLVVGPPNGLQHGGRLGLSIATDGVPQEVLDFSYVALFPVGEHALLRGRAGMPLVLRPDSTIGLELGVGAAWLITGGLGLTADLVGNLFYGAATQDRETTTIPVLALQVGAFFDHEVLP